MTTLQTQRTILLLSNTMRYHSRPLIAYCVLKDGEERGEKAKEGHPQSHQEDKKHVR